MMYLPSQNTKVTKETIKYLLHTVLHRIGVNNETMIHNFIYVSFVLKVFYFVHESVFYFLFFTHYNVSPKLCKNNQLL